MSDGVAMLATYGTTGWPSSVVFCALVAALELAGRPAILHDETLIAAGTPKKVATWEIEFPSASKPLIIAPSTGVDIWAFRGDGRRNV